MPESGVFTQGQKQRTMLAAVEAAIVVAALYFFGQRDWLLIGSVAGAVAISAMAPPRIAYVVSGVSLLSLAGMFYFKYKAEKLAIVLGVIGLLALAYGVTALRIPGKKR